MKLLLEESNRVELDRIRMLLEANGIPVFIGNEAVARNFWFLTLTQKYKLWVMEDSQLGCASSLLQDETYEVKNPIDVNEYYQSLADIKPDINSFIWNKLILPGAILVVVLFAIILLLINA